jgi:hypothetical protein
MDSLLLERPLSRPRRASLPQPAPGQPWWFAALPPLLGLATLGPSLATVILAPRLALFSLAASVVNVPIFLHGEPRRTGSPIRAVALIGALTGELLVTGVAFLRAATSDDVVLAWTFLLGAPFALTPAALLGAGLAAAIHWAWHPNLRGART